MGIKDPGNGTSIPRSHPVRSIVLRPGLAERQAQSRDAAGTIRAVLDEQAAAVGFGDLSAQGQADAGTGRLSGKEVPCPSRGSYIELWDHLYSLGECERSV